MTPEDKPPFFKNWTYWYSALSVFLAVLILLFYLITITFQ